MVRQLRNVVAGAVVVAAVSIGTIRARLGASRHHGDGAARLLEGAGGAPAPELELVDGLFPWCACKTATVYVQCSQCDLDVLDVQHVSVGTETQQVSVLRSRTRSADTSRLLSQVISFDENTAVAINAPANRNPQGVVARVDVCGLAFVTKPDIRVAGSGNPTGLGFFYTGTQLPITAFARGPNFITSEVFSFSDPAEKTPLSTQAEWIFDSPGSSQTRPFTLRFPFSNCAPPPDDAANEPGPDAADQHADRTGDSSFVATAAPQASITQAPAETPAETSPATSVTEAPSSTRNPSAVSDAPSSEPVVTDTTSDAPSASAATDAPSSSAATDAPSSSDASDAPSASGDDDEPDDAPSSSDSTDAPSSEPATDEALTERPTTTESPSTSGGASKPPVFAPSAPGDRTAPVIPRVLLVLDDYPSKIVGHSSFANKFATNLFAAGSVEVAVAYLGSSGDTHVSESSSELSATLSAVAGFAASFSVAGAKPRSQASTLPGIWSLKPRWSGGLQPATTIVLISDGIDTHGMAACASKPPGAPKTICIQTESKHVTKTTACICDEQWKAKDVKYGHYANLGLVAKEMRNWVFPPDVKLADPCAAVNKMADATLTAPQLQSAKRTACRAVAADELGRKKQQLVRVGGGTPKRQANVQCWWRAHRCQLLTKFSPLYAPP